MWKSECRQNYYRISFSPTVPPFAARISRVVADGGTWRLKWERLKAGESNGKLPPRTCPQCSVPEPYRSHDWALVPAKPGLQGWILKNECVCDVLSYLHTIYYLISIRCVVLLTYDTLSCICTMLFLIFQKCVQNTSRLRPHILNVRHWNVNFKSQTKR